MFPIVLAPVIYLINKQSLPAHLLIVFGIPKIFSVDPIRSMSSDSFGREQSSDVLDPSHTKSTHVDMEGAASALDEVKAAAVVLLGDLVVVSGDRRPLRNCSPRRRHRSDRAGQRSPHVAQRSRGRPAQPALGGKLLRKPLCLFEWPPKPPRRAGTAPSTNRPGQGGAGAPVYGRRAWPRRSPPRD